MQIDVKKIQGNTVLCNLYTGNDGDRCVQIIMTTQDYQLLCKDGFFIRDGKSEDSAGLLNTTRTYHEIAYIDGRRELVRM